MNGQTAQNGNSDDETATTVKVVNGFDTARRVGTTTGVSDGSICEGWYPTSPNHILQVDESLGMTVRATSDDDVRSWLLGGQSNFCSTGASAEEVSRFWTRGSVEVYVGTLEQGSQIEYVLEFIEN